MKKYLFGLFAVALAIGFSAFTTPDVKVSKARLTDKFFSIANSYSLNTAVASADATYLGESDPGSSGCSGSGKQCISRFSSTQVNGSNQLVDDSQVPIDSPYEKN